MHLHQELEDYYLGVIDGMHAYPGRSYPIENHGMAEMTNNHHKRGAGRLKEDHRSSRAVSIAPKFVLLILEDFDEIRAFLSRHFSEHGYEVYSSATLPDALAIAYEEEPHVMIIDYDLNGETAIHAISRLHEAKPESCLVLIGGPGTAEVETNALAAGASKVLSRAYALSEMEEIVENAFLATAGEWAH